ncbi:MAG: hypothetical protein NTV11_01590 [Rhodocyclales bacterium]|nr:hypothetical protein [Rhodocyclales bacterium]
MKTSRVVVVFLRHAAIGCCLFGAAAQAQTVPDAEPSQRIEIGGGFSVGAPTGEGWRKTGDPDYPVSYVKVLGPEHHSLALIASTGPTGITREDILGMRQPGGVDKMFKLMAGVFERVSKMHAASMLKPRFGAVELVNDIVSLNNRTTCTYSRIVARDRETLLDGVPTKFRFVAYTCLWFPGYDVAASVTYSERGGEQDLSKDAMAEGERFVRSLQRAE